MEYRSRDYDDTIFHRTNTRKRHFGEDPNACPDNTSQSGIKKEERGTEKGGEIKISLLSRQGRGKRDDGNDVSLL